MNLTEILKEIKANQVFASEDLDDPKLPRETLNGRRGRKAKAIETIQNLRSQYRGELLRNSLFILVTGESREEFVATAKEKFACFSADPNAFYKDLANRVNEALYLGKESVSNMLDVVGRHLEDKARELGVIGYPQIVFKQEYRRAIKTKEEFTDLIAQVINDQVGSEMVGLQTISNIVDEAIDKNHSAIVTPIVLSVSDSEFALKILPGLERLTRRVFVVSAGNDSELVKSREDVVSLTEVTNKEVKQTLLDIRKSLKK